MEKTLEKIVALAKSRGFVYPGSEIYGGLANTWDYGNLGVELKNNVKKACRTANILLIDELLHLLCCPAVDWLFRLLSLLGIVILNQLISTETLMAALTVH